MPSQASASVASPYRVCECWRVPQDWEEVKLYGREVVIAFDADVMVNPNVQKALQDLADFLRERGALVKYLLWPERYRGTKTGIDDYLAAGGKIVELNKTAQEYPDIEAIPVGIMLSEVQAETVEWLWERRIPLGKITVLDGDPDNGKSVLTTDLAARVTTGRAMPYRVSEDAARSGVVILSAEDGAGDTIRPSISTLPAATLQGRHYSARRPARHPGGPRPDLERAIKQVDAKLVIVDPIMAFLGRGGQPQPRQGSSLGPHAGQAASRAPRRSPCVIVRHLNKTPGGNVLYRGGGSIGIIGAARVGLLVGPHPDDEDLRVLAGQKSNLGPPPESLKYRIETAENDSARVKYEGTVEMKPQDLLKGPQDEEERSAADEARDFLRAVLAGGVRKESNLVKAEAKVLGISETTLNRVKRSIGVKSVKIGETWFMSLSDDVAEGEGATDSRSASRQPTDDNLDHLGNLPFGGKNSGPAGKMVIDDNLDNLPSDAASTTTTNGGKRAYLSEDGQDGQGSHDLLNTLQPVAANVASQGPEEGGQDSQDTTVDHLPYAHVTTEVELAPLLDELRLTKGAVALDTETFDPNLGPQDKVEDGDALDVRLAQVRLIQVKTEDGSPWVIDAKSVGTAPLFEALRGKTLIMHNAAYDLAVLRTNFGYVHDGSVSDTMLAAQVFYAGKFNLDASLQGLLEKLLEVKISKEEQATHWGVDSLSDAQLAYAAADVEHLHELAEVLRTRVRKSAGLEDVVNLENEISHSCGAMLPNSANTDVKTTESGFHEGPPAVSSPSRVTSRPQMIHDHASNAIAHGISRLSAETTSAAATTTAGRRTRSRKAGDQQHEGDEQDQDDDRGHAAQRPHLGVAAPGGDRRARAGARGRRAARGPQGGRLVVRGRRVVAVGGARPEVGDPRAQVLELLLDLLLERRALRALGVAGGLGLDRGERRGRRAGGLEALVRRLRLLGRPRGGGRRRDGLRRGVLGRRRLAVVGDRFLSRRRGRLVGHLVLGRRRGRLVGHLVLGRPRLVAAVQPPADARLGDLRADGGELGRMPLLGLLGLLGGGREALAQLVDLLLPVRALLRVLRLQALQLGREILALGGETGALRGQVLPLGGGLLDAAQLHGRLLGHRLARELLADVHQLALAPGELRPQAVDLGAQRAGLEPQLLRDRRLLLRLRDGVAAPAAALAVGQRQLDDDVAAELELGPDDLGRVARPVEGRVPALRRGAQLPAGHGDDALAASRVELHGEDGPGEAPARRAPSSARRRRAGPRTTRTPRARTRPRARVPSGRLASRPAARSLPAAASAPSPRSPMRPERPPAPPPPAGRERAKRRWDRLRSSPLPSAASAGTASLSSVVGSAGPRASTASTRRRGSRGSIVNARPHAAERQQAAGDHDERGDEREDAAELGVLARGRGRRVEDLRHGDQRDDPRGPRQPAPVDDVEVRARRARSPRRCTPTREHEQDDVPHLERLPGGDPRLVPVQEQAHEQEQRSQRHQQRTGLESACHTASRTRSLIPCGPHLSTNARRTAPTGARPAMPGGTAGRSSRLLEADGRAGVLEAAERHRDGDAERLRRLADQRPARLARGPDLDRHRLAGRAAHRLDRDAAARQAELARGLPA